MLASANRLPEAEARLDDLVTTEPNHVDVLDTLAKVKSQLGKFQEVWNTNNVVVINYGLKNTKCFKNLVHIITKTTFKLLVLIGGDKFEKKWNNIFFRELNCLPEP